MKHTITTKMETFYVTTPIYYVSGKPHLGHAYTSIACDAIARWQRIKQKKVFFLTGTDEHGQKIANKAKEKEMSEKEFVDSLIPMFKNLNETLQLSHDFFIRTTDEYHKKFVQKMLQKAYDKGDIYKANYEGLYCVDCEKYYDEKDLIDGKVCPDHKRPVQKMSEENYFFKLSKYQEKLLELYENNPEFLSPKKISLETINRVKEGLKDISISRRKETLTWGIELPFDKGHVTYVWFDALFNYISGLEHTSNMEQWPANIHVVGKDINWFHSVYWPAFLTSTGYELPKKIFAHGWWTVEGEKMGKSMNNVLEPIKIIKEFGLDEFKYYVLTVGRFGEDKNFSKEELIERINSELNNSLGNLVSRTKGMIKKYFEGELECNNSLREIEQNLIKKSNINKDFEKHMNELNFQEAIRTVFKFINEVNAYVDEVKPWKEENEDNKKIILTTLVSSIKLISTYLEFIMPNKTKLMRQTFNLDNNYDLEMKILEGNIKINEEIKQVFTKIEI
ncbi:MAG: methionine--tRNA ligase [Candidatus Woesearchaeota archaeon]